MFGIGLPELLFILALALIVLGPERLPKVATQMARLLGELKKVGEDFKNQLDLEGLRDIKDSVSKAKIYPEDVGELKTADIKRKVGDTNAGTHSVGSEEGPESRAAGKDEDSRGPEIQLHGGGESRPEEQEEGKKDAAAEPHGPDPHSDVP